MTFVYKIVIPATCLMVFHNFVFNLPWFVMAVPLFITMITPLIMVLILGRKLITLKNIEALDEEIRETNILVIVGWFILSVACTVLVR